MGTAEIRVRDCLVRFSRMCELGLVDRYRVGQRGVGYDLTDKGHEFLRAHMEE
mgnify:FL=1